MNDDKEKELKSERAAYMRDWNRRRKEAMPELVKEELKAKYQRQKHHHKARYDRLKTDPKFRAAAVERATKWSKDNSERRKEYMRDYMRKNRAKLVARSAAWKKANPERAKTIAVHSSHLRRTRLVQTPKLQRDQARSMMQRERKKKTHVCYYCKSRFKGTMHWDHVIPVSKGGTHSPDNLCVACPECNLKKADNGLSKVSMSDNMLLPI